MSSLKDTNTREFQTIPQSIKIAVWMMLISILILGVANDILGWTYLKTMGPLSYIVTIQLITLTFLCWLVYKVSVGRNWARITLFILTIIGIPLSLPATFDYFTRSIFLGLTSSTQLIIQLIALYLFFSKPGSLYFKKIGQTRGHG